VPTDSSAPRAPQVSFTPINFSPSSWVNYASKRVDILKIDCEGCEFDAIPNFLEHVRTEQLLLEVHGCTEHRDWHDVAKLMSAINATMGTFQGLTHRLLAVGRSGTDRGHRVLLPQASSTESRTSSTRTARA